MKLPFDDFVCIIKTDVTAKNRIPVIPAQAGIQKYLKALDAGSSPA
ncbi:hypothetical protein [Desulforegula conservatrix]|nr:hypothetical protein [Desulforegula conservatrix]